MNMRIIGSGSCIPEIKVSNQDFENHRFLDSQGKQLSQPTENIITKCMSITGIGERRYAQSHLVTSDLAAVAAKRAITNAGIDAETIDYIIVAHNFGDVRFGSVQKPPSLRCRQNSRWGNEAATCCFLRQ